MEAIGGRMTLQEIAADHAIVLCDPAHLSAPHGFTGDLPEAPDDSSRRSIRTIPLPGGSQAGHGGGSGLGHRHHLNPTQQRLSRPGGDRRLLLQERPHLEAL
jgi:hypothetical protein